MKPGYGGGQDGSTNPLDDEDALFVKKSGLWSRGTRCVARPQTTL